MLFFFNSLFFFFFNQITVGHNWRKNSCAQYETVNILARNKKKKLAKTSEK